MLRRWLGIVVLLLEEEEEEEEGGEEEDDEDDLFPNPLNPFDVDFEEERRLADSVVVEYVVVCRGDV